MQGKVGVPVYQEQRVNAPERLYLALPIMDAVESCGEKCANLCSVYKLIMVSRVPGYGHLEYLVLESIDVISSCYSKLILIWVNDDIFNWDLSWAYLLK